MMKNVDVSTMIRADETGQVFMAKEQFDALMARLDNVYFWAEMGLAFQQINHAMTQNPDAELVFRGNQIFMHDGNNRIGTQHLQLGPDDLLRAARWVSGH